MSQQENRVSDLNFSKWVEGSAPLDDDIEIVPLAAARARAWQTCLVVDDSSVIRKIARRILEDMDSRLSRPSAAKRRWRSASADCPRRSCWNMPVTDGYEFLGNLRRMPGGDQPKVVFCTTENDVAHIARASRRRQRTHHETVRQQGHHCRQVPGNWFVPVNRAGVIRFCGPKEVRLRFASGQQTSTESTSGRYPRPDRLRRDGCRRWRIGIRVTVSSPAI
jgi:two-component system, chemotaxis family, chemotaxis protein CheY